MSSRNVILSREALRQLMLWSGRPAVVQTSDGVQASRARTSNSRYLRALRRLSWQASNTTGERSSRHQAPVQAKPFFRPSQRGQLTYGPCQGVCRNHDPNGLRVADVKLLGPEQCRGGPERALTKRGSSRVGLPRTGCSAGGVHDLMGLTSRRCSMHLASVADRTIMVSMSMSMSMSDLLVAGPS